MELKPAFWRAFYFLYKLIVSYKVNIDNKKYPSKLSGHGKQMIES